VGKDKGDLTRYAQAAQVVKALEYSNGLLTKAAHLAAIHKLPEECWQEAVEMWKRLYPGETRGGDHKSENRNHKSMVLFPDFAKAKFKTAQTYAERALAILNYSTELFEDAKDDLAGTYKIYQERVSEDKEKRRNTPCLYAPQVTVLVS